MTAAYTKSSSEVITIIFPEIRFYGFRKMKNRQPHTDQAKMCTGGLATALALLALFRFLNFSDGFHGFLEGVESFQKEKVY